MKDKFIKNFLFVIMFSNILVLILYLTIDYKNHLYYNKYIFSDFAETLLYNVVLNPYVRIKEIACIYLPISYKIFFVFSNLNKDILLSLMNKEIIYNDLICNKLFLISYFTYVYLSVLSIYYLIRKSSIYMVFIIIFSGPFIYCFLRGNIINLSFIGLLIYIKFNNKNKYLNELANISLAFSVAIKIYPVIFLCLLYKNNNFKSNLIKVLIYIFFLTFIPFLYVEETFGNIGLLIKNVINFSSIKAGSTNVSLVGMLRSLSRYIYLSNNLLFYISLFVKFMSIIVAYVFTVNKVNKHQYYFVIVSCYIFMQDVSYVYCLLFYIISFLQYLKEKRYDFIISLFYVLCLSSLMYFVKLSKVVTIYALVIFIIYIIKLLKGVNDYKNI